MGRLDRVLSSRHLAFWGLLASIATVIGLLVTVIVAFRPTSAPDLNATVSQTAPVDPPVVASPSITPSSATAVPNLVPSPTTSPPPRSATEIVSQLDYYAERCGVGVSSGPVSLNGTEYVHAIQQWAGNSSDSFNLSRKARRFQAIVGIRDDASDKVRAQFELRGDNGQQLFVSRVLGFGETQTVDISVEGVLRITLGVKGLSKAGGYAGWGEARVTSLTELKC